jgi:hypothetical protein
MEKYTANVGMSQAAWKQAIRIGVCLFFIALSYISQKST